MKKLKLIITLFIISTMLSSCNNDDNELETSSVEDALTVEETLLLTDSNSKNLNFQKAFREEIESTAKQISKDENFINILTKFSSLVAIPAYLASNLTENEEEEFISAINRSSKENNLESMAMYMGLDENTLEQEISEIKKDFIEFRKNNNDFFANEKRMNLILDVLDNDTDLQNVVLNRVNKKLSFSDCIHLCDSGVAGGCALVTVGGLIRKMTSCWAMTGGRFVACAGGVLAEQIGQGVVCAIGYEFCVVKCEEKILRESATSPARRKRINKINHTVQPRYNLFKDKYFKAYRKKYGYYPQGHGMQTYHLNAAHPRIHGNVFI